MTMSVRKSEIDDLGDAGIGGRPIRLLATGGILISSSGGGSSLFTMDFSESTAKFSEFGSTKNCLSFAMFNDALDLGLYNPNIAMNQASNRNWAKKIKIFVKNVVILISIR